VHYTRLVARGWDAPIPPNSKDMRNVLYEGNWSLNRFLLPPLSEQLIGVYAAFQPTDPVETWLKSATSSLSFFIESVLASIAVRHLLLRLVCLPWHQSLEQLYQGRWFIFTLFLTRYIAREVRNYRRLSHIKEPRLAQFSEL